MNLPQGLQYGLIAQDVEAVLPALVCNNFNPATKDSAGNIINPAVNFKGLEYQQLIPILIAGFNEQQHIIDSLKTASKTKDSLQDARLTALEAAVNTCCSNSARHTASISSQDVTLSDKDVIVLNQNVPNPFAEQTVITYNIPENTGFAQLLFYDVNGRQIKSVDITTKGAGQLNVYANDLTNGMYSYTLIVDGKIIDTKRMVKQQ